MIPKDIDKWDNNQWMRQMVYCRPSSGGAVGVVFAWAGRAYARQSFSKPAEAAFVIKPIQGSASPTKFAEHILSRIAGAVSPNSKPISRRSLSGSGLVLTLKIFRDRETDAKIKSRWQEVFKHYDGADTFLIQEVQAGIKEFGDEFREQGGLAKMLLDTPLMTNLGKLFAADALIGNGDRLDQINSGNIIFKADGTLAAIDSVTVLTSFQAILNDVTMQSNSHGSPHMPASHWAQQDVVRSGYRQVPSPAQQKQANPQLAPSMGVNVIFDIDTYWARTFRGGLEFKMNNMNPKPFMPPDTAWDHGKMCFKRGVEEGIRQIDQKLSGLNWVLTKNKYKSYVTRFGGDPNLDWMNFKIRRKYIKLRYNGMPEDQAIQAVQDYVARKMPGL